MDVLMKIYYMNDENTTVQVRVIDDKGENTHHSLGPHSGQEFEFNAPEGAIPYVKRWSNRTVMLSYMLIPQKVNA